MNYKLIYIIIILLFSCTKDEEIGVIKDLHVYISRAEFIEMFNATTEGGTLDMHGAIAMAEGIPFEINRSMTIINGGFKKSDTPTAVLTQDIKPGDTIAYVNDTSGFKVGQYVAIVYGVALDQHTGIVRGVIKNISDNSITTKVHPRGALAGSILIQSHQLLTLKKEKMITLRCIFDGNKQNNNYTYDWKLNKTVTLHGSEHIIENSIIKNTPSENFTLKQGAVVRNNLFFNLSGSFVHFSNSQDAMVETQVIDNIGDGVCQVDESINGHNEGCFTFSRRSQWLKIEGNIVKNGGESCYGHQGLDDYNINVKNNLFENFKRKIHSIDTDHPDPIDASMDKFINVPD